MPRCPARSPKDKTKLFKVAPGHRIGDPNKEGNNPVEAGQMVALTEAEARYFLSRGAIQLELDFGDDDDDDDAAGKSSDGNPAEAGSGTETEGDGDPSAGAVPGPDAVQTDGDGKAGRRSRSL